MWQYTSNGNVSGISTNVDINVAYFGYSQSAGTMSGETAAAASADVEANMIFTSVNDTVTAKEYVRLRNKPSQDTDSTIIATLNNGETVTRTGISDSGWSRLNYNGQNVYAVSSYLTTDLSVPTQTETQQFMTQFISCNDEVTPKDEVNLRSKPSYTDSDSVVVAFDGQEKTVSGRIFTEAVLKPSDILCFDGRGYTVVKVTPSFALDGVNAVNEVYFQ